MSDPGQFSGRRAMRLLAPLLALCGLSAAAPAMAGKTVVMTPTTINAALAALAPGDTLQLQGTFSTTLRISNRDFGGVRVDASGAVLLEGMNLTNVHNIAFSGGVFGRNNADTRDWHTIRVTDSSHVSLVGAAVVGNGNTTGLGLGVLRSSFITVRDNEFTGHRDGMGIRESQDSLITGNRFIASRSDGISMQSNMRMIVSENSCTGIDPFVGAHPDCIQMWTLAGAVLQSDIYILNNYAAGATQAFVSFDPKDNSGIRLTFAGNYAAITYPHGVSCYGCTDSVMVDNMFITPFGTQHLVGLRHPTGTNNYAANNQWFDFRNNSQAMWPTHVFSSLVPTLAGLVGSIHESRSYNSRLVAASFSLSDDEPVPEPATWLLLMLGFALVGRQLRQQGGPARVMA